MYKRLKSFIGSNGILFSGQYGFRDKHSTQYALLNVVNAIQENIDHNVFSCGIFLDFKKAFDTVDLSVFKTVFIFMHDVAHDSVPLNLKNLLHSSNQVHSYNTRFSSAGNYYVNSSRTNVMQNSISRLGPNLWNSLNNTT